jgi:glycosyltransferase involved in cell wall biosynthesis
VHSSLERKLLDAAANEFGDALDYRGPVYQLAKRKFFQDIHVKLFPTRYPDAQPLVVTESFAFSRPVIAFGRGCIPAMIGDAGNWSIPTDDDFVARAAEQIERWIDDPKAYADACRAARRRYDAMLDEAARALEDFGRWVCGEPANGFVHGGSNGAANQS